MRGSSVPLRYSRTLLPSEMSQSTSRGNCLFCGYSLLDDARGVTLSEPVSGLLANGLRTSGNLLGSTAGWLFGHVNLLWLGWGGGSLQATISTLTFGCAKELSSWYLMAVGMLAGGGSFSGADASAVSAPTVTGSYCGSVGSVV